MPVSAAVDDREPAALVARLRAHPDVAAVEQRRLSAGDIVIGDVGFERKTPEDYLRSAMGRFGSDLEGQIEKLIEGYADAYVLLEGEIADLEECRPGVAGASVRGSIASLTARFEIAVVPCGDRERLVDMAVRLARKHTEDPSRRPLRPGAVTGRSEPTAKRMYGCIEGVGPGTAQRLYEVYPTVESLLAATREELLAIDGIGPKRADAIYEGFRQEE